MTFPMTEQEEYENAGLTEEQKMHIEELSTKKSNNKKTQNTINGKHSKNRY